MLRDVWTRMRSKWRIIRRSPQLETEMQDEMRFHVEMETEARRQAHVRLGGLEKYKEAGRDVRGLRWIDALLLDSRFGVRMLVKHRGLTVVGAFAMAVAIAVGATLFVLTLIMNVFAIRLVRKYREVYE